MRTNNEIIIQSLPLNTNQSSDAIPLQNIFGYAVYAEFTGTTVEGTLKLQASCEPSPNGAIPTMPVKFDDVANSSITLTEAGSYIWNVTDVMYTYVRVVFTDTSSGTNDGVLTCNINIKGL